MGTFFHFFRLLPMDYEFQFVHGSHILTSTKLTFGYINAFFLNYATLAPPPESIWAADAEVNDDEESIEDDDDFNMEFELEDDQETLGKNPMMPWLVVILC